MGHGETETETVTETAVYKHKCVKIYFKCFGGVKPLAKRK